MKTKEVENVIEFNVKADKSVGKLKHTWNYIGYDECNYTHTPEGEQLLSQFGELADAPYYIRTHHLFCTGNSHGVYKWGSTNVYSEDEAGHPVYDWSILNEILDVFLRTGNKPFFELGFMPLDLVDPAYMKFESVGERYKEYKDSGWACPPKDYGKWYDLVYETIKHCIDRYDKDEVLTWYWELWNEPDIIYWQGTENEFFKLYDYTEAAVHAALLEARLGGPATTGPSEGSNSQQYLDHFLAHCSNGVNYVSGKRGTRLDYITFHVKGGGFPFQPNALKATPLVSRFVEQARTGMELIRKYGYQDKEIVLSEADPDGWAAGGIYDNPNMSFRNTEYFASYVAASYHQLYRLSEEMGMDVRPLAWTFLFRGERCFEGTRSFTTQGIHKAVFNIFKIFARLGARKLELTASTDTSPSIQTNGAGQSPDKSDVNGLAAINNEGHIQVMIYSHHDDWDIRREYEIQLQIDHLTPNQSYRLIHYRIDGKHSNAYQEWVTQGKPHYTSDEQYAAIKARDGLELFESEMEITTSNGLWTYRFPLPAHGVSFIELIPGGYY